jgi:hypothetical protein
MERHYLGSVLGLWRRIALPMMLQILDDKGYNSVSLGIGG